MEIIRLPHVLPGSLDLKAVSRRLARNDAQLDWSNVGEASLASLADLLSEVSGFDLGSVSDALGSDTMSDAVAQAVADAWDAATRKRTRPSRSSSISSAAQPILWPTGATQPAIWSAISDEPLADESDTLTPVLQDEDSISLSETPAEATDTPVLARASQAEIRRKLQAMVRGELLGPANGEEEEIAGERVSNRYILGMLAPRRSALNPSTQDDLSVSIETDEDGTPEPSDTASTSLSPSSFGLTFCVVGQAKYLRVSARWGRYERTTSETLVNPKDGNPRRVWKRHPVSGVIARLPLQPGKIEPQYLTEEQPNVFIRGEIRQIGGDWIVTLFLVNDQDEPKQLRDKAWLFQPEMVVAAPDGEAIFRRHAIPHQFQHLDAIDQREQRALAMLYRQHLEFAIGHGVSVHASIVADNPTLADCIETRVIPSYEVPKTISPDTAQIPGLAQLPLDMKTLAAMDADTLRTALLPLPVAYEQWMNDQANRLNDPSTELTGHEQAVSEALATCRDASQRIREGIELLARNANAAEAFRFMNQAMWLQRLHTLASDETRKGAKRAAEDFDQPQNRTWRLFQIAFILLNLPALTNLHHPDRSGDAHAIADLLWFPTGGGKTEAYLGLTAYTLAMRRLQGTVAGRSGEAGVAVLMRYTLRLLTLQQFQRAAALICACEQLRQERLAQGDARWGKTPFRLGLWVGQRTTPNYTDQSADAVQQDNGRYKSAGTFGGSGSPAQLTYCPWCGAKIDPSRNIKVNSYKNGTGRTLIYCGDPMGVCPFSERQASGEGLPVLVVDEEIYRRLPALIIATVDKFAQLPWKGPVGMLFGQVTGYCPRHGYRSHDLTDSDSHPARNGLPAVKTQPCAPLRPPDLIIQDELHLISGPLGTLVGLYESAVDRLASWEVDGQRVRPKVIASTATIRRASEQMHALFLRDVRVFPPQGLDAEDNFFSQQVPPSDDDPGRLYLGMCAFGRRLKLTLIRVYAAYLLAAATLYEEYGALADPWMTLVGYFNSMRELAGMIRLVDENVRQALANGERHGFKKRWLPYREELTSRKSALDIPRLLDLMEVGFTPEQIARALGKVKSQATIPRPIDVLLATNMISVGVDIKRLGLMVVADQPKTTAEYIQATSRVGRSFPGLVCTVFNWSRPRDLSHYETFQHYHATFYSKVEALSVTPFSPRALDRGLSGLLAALIRQYGAEFNANEQASAITADHPYVRQAVNDLINRAAQVTGSANVSAMVKQELDRRLEYWLSEAANRTGGRVLGYQEKRDGKTLGLLHPPDVNQWRLFTSLNSLREVEPEITLLRDDFAMGDETGHPFAPMVYGAQGDNDHTALVDDGDDEEEDDYDS